MFPEEQVHFCASTVQPRHIRSPITVYPGHVFWYFQSRSCLGATLGIFTTPHWLLSLAWTSTWYPAARCADILLINLLMSVAHTMLGGAYRSHRGLVNTVLLARREWSSFLRQLRPVFWVCVGSSPLVWSLVCDISPNLRTRGLLLSPAVLVLRCSRFFGWEMGYLTVTSFWG